MRMRLGIAAASLAAVVVLSALPARGADLTGTWQGPVIVGGQAQEFEASFSADGYLLLTYTNNRGEVRTVELSAPGQVQFVPPGGGVSTVAVQSVVKRPGGISYVLHTGFERTSGGYLTQQYAVEEIDYALTIEGLRVRLVRQAASYFGDRQPVGGPQATEIYEGVLKKMQ